MTMCKRVGLSHRVGTYILAMCRLKMQLPGDLIDMVEVAQVIKYVSENQEDLKPQFQMGIRFTDADIQSHLNGESSGNFTFLK